MRKGKRFTSKMLQQWARKGRGTGTGNKYEPWHQVRRSDPSSCGRSHIISWFLNRQHHLLSDLEKVVFAFSTMHPGLVDVLEQYPLSLNEHPCELSKFSTDGIGRQASGTIDLAKSLGIKHPKLRSKEGDQPWIMSTDLLLVIQSSEGQFELLAISIKYDEALTSPRKLELLNIEREYWVSQGITWLLITPQLYSELVKRTVVSALPWALSCQIFSQESLKKCQLVVKRNIGNTITKVLRDLEHDLEVEMSTAQQLFWRAVWGGEVLLDCERFSLVGDPIRLLSIEKFTAQNPVLGRASSWSL